MAELLALMKYMTGHNAAHTEAVSYTHLHESGYRIPDDISVIGHDDTEVASILIPTLTTMQQEKRKIGRIAAQSMFRILSTGTLKEDVIIVPTKLIERKSVKKLSE